MAFQPPMYPEGRHAKKLSRTDYTVGWICALSIEMAASVGMLEDEHQDLDAAQGDRNMYTLGEIGGHNIVMACLPSGNMGITPAATVARDMLRSFPKIRFGLMVGIGGGAPAPRARPSEDIRLGDVVVSIPQGELGGVVKYDRGKVVAGGEFKHAGLLNMPPSLLTNAVAKLRAMHEKKRNKITRNIAAMINNTLESEDANPDFADQYQFPGLDYDQSFDADYEHNDSVEPAPDSQQDEKSFGEDQDEDEDEIPQPCRNCDKTRLVRRKPRKSTDPVIHYGTIASADQVMRHGATRERIRKQFSVLCFEMEAAGLMNDFPCLVIRGICDYSDTHKHKIWQRYAAATAAAYAKELLGVVLKQEIENTEEVVKVLQRVEEDKQQQDYQRVLDWLSSNTHMGRFIDSYNRWHQGTAQRFLNSKEYLHWANENTQTLWCPGIAGGGKTIFASVAVHNLKTEKQKTNVGIAFLFCEYARMKSENIQSLAAAILSQLADQCAVFPESVSALHTLHRDNKMPLRFEEISSALIGVLQSFSQVFLVIDALDECSEQTRRELLSYLLEQQKKTRIKLLVTSRPTIDFQEEFGGCEILEIRANEQDVKIVLGNLIEKLPTFVRTDEALRDRVKNDIAEAVDGMFVLVELFLDSLQGERSRGDLNKALTALMNSTDKVSTVYDRTLIRIGSQNPKDCELAHRTLSWIVESKRPLTRQELQHALAVKPGSPSFQDEDIFDNLEEIVALCAGLVVINQRSNTVQLMHHTTRKYFEDEKHHPDWLVAAHRMIASVCLTYLSFTIFGVGPCRNDEELESRLSKYPFFRYAAQHWGNHARDDHDQNPELKMLASKFLDDDARVNSSNQVVNLPEQRYPGYSQRYTRKVSGLHTGASFGLTNVIQNLIDNGADTRAEDEEGRTALHRGAENGHSAVVPILLKHGADVDAVDLKFGQTPLHLAALNGHDEVVQVLLEGGANTNMKDDDDWMAIHVAAWTGKENVVRLLLEKTDVNETGKHRLTALHCAAAQGHETVANLLIDKNANINAKDSGGWTPLHWASKKRHDVMNPRVLNLKDQPSQLLRQMVSQQKELRTLVEHQNVVIQDKVSTIKSKLTYWHGKLAWLPSQVGLDVEGEYDDILTGLDMASDMQSLRLNMLSSSGQREEQPGPARLIFAIQDELTALRCVTECGHEKVALLLLKHQAEMKSSCEAKLEFDFIDAEPQPLHLAAFSDHEAMVRMLLNEGADVHEGCETSMLHGLTGELHAKVSSLHFAIASGNESVAQLLMEKGANIHTNCLLGIQNRHFELTSLHLAVICGNLRMVQELLSKRVDINARCQMNFNIADADVKQGPYMQADLTPVHLATLLGRFDILQLLLENNADVQMKVQLSIGSMSLQLSALHIALVCNRKETVRLLLQYRADVEATLCVSKDTLICVEVTVLHLNAHFQDIEILQLLIERGADVNGKGQIDYDGWELPRKEAEEETMEKAETTENGASEDAAGLTAQLSNAFLGEEVATPSNGETAEAYERPRRNISRVNVQLMMVHIAALYGNYEMLKVLLENKADPNAKLVLCIGKNYADITISPLHIAVIRRNKEMTLLLLAAGASTCAKLSFTLGVWLHTEVTALQLAVISCNEEMVQTILENGTESIHLECRLTIYLIQIKLTALHLTVLFGYESAMALLLKHGADVNEKFFLNIENFHIQSKAIHLATVLGDVGVVQLLLDNKSDPADICQINNDTENIVTPLHLAAILNYEDLIRLLVKHQAKASLNCRIKLDPWLDLHLSALHLVTIRGNMDMVQVLLEAGSDASLKGSLRSSKANAELVDITVLHLAAMWGHERAMEQLLEAKCDVDAKFQIITQPWLHIELSVLHVAAFGNRDGIVPLLLAKRPDVRPKIQIKGPYDSYIELTALNLAGLWNDERMAQALLDLGADADSRCLINTPELNISINSLHMAAALRNERMMHLLLSTTPLPERSSPSSSSSSSLYLCSEWRSREGSRERWREHSREWSREHSRERPREHSREFSRESSREDPRERPREHSRERSRELSRENPRERSREYPREHSRERSRECSRERSRQRSRGRSREWSREYSREHSREQSRQRSRGRSREWSREWSRKWSRGHSKEHWRERWRGHLREYPRERSTERLMQRFRKGSRSQKIIKERYQSIEKLNERTSIADPNAMLMLNVGNTLFELNAVHMAALAGSMQMTQLLCDNGADVNVVFAANSRTKHCEFTALHLAVLGKSQAMVQYLLENRADIHPKFRVVVGNIHAEFSTLHLAVVCKQSPGIPALILEKSPDIEEKCHIGFNRKGQVELTLLHLIALSGQDVIAGLLTTGVDARTKFLAKVHVCVNLELTTVELAKVFHNRLLAFLLQDEDEQTGPKDQPRVHFRQLVHILATILGYERFMKLSLGVMKNVDEAFTIGLTMKVETGLAIPVQGSTGATFDVQIEAEMCLLHLASALGLEEVVSSLAKKGANLEAKCKVKVGDAICAEFTALHLAVMLKQNEVVFQLIRIGANAEATSQVDIKRTVQAGLIVPHLTTLFGQEGFLRFLKKDIALETKVQAQLTSLHLAALLDNDDVTWSLLYLGTDANARCLVNVGAETHGNSNTNLEARLSALHIAAGLGHEMIVRLLVEKGANVDLAVEVTGIAVVDHGVHLRRKIRAGGTALHMVAGLGNERIAEMLIDSGVNVDLKSQDGRTALRWARIHGHDEVAHLILERRAQIKKEGEKKNLLHKIFSKDMLTPRSIPDSQEEIGQDQGNKSGTPKKNHDPRENLTPFLRRFVVRKAGENLNRIRRGLFSKPTPTSLVKTEDDFSDAQNKDAEALTQETNNESEAVD